MASVEFEDPTIQSKKIEDVRFTVTSQHYKVTYGPNKINWGTRMFAKYEVPEVMQLEDYAVVQFIRGCQFNTMLDEGKIAFVDNILREFFNELVTYKHTDWVIDSVDLDPMYNNTPVEYQDKWNTRHGFYRWNRNHNYDQDAEVLYYQEKPDLPYLYVMDHPGTSFIEGGWAKNVSLKFKTCLYKTKDIPKVTTPTDLNFAKAVQCFDWSSSFIYDHSDGSFSRPKELHPHCLDQSR